MSATTLGEALVALHRCGRIRSPWLPGMLGIDAAGVRFRFVSGHPQGGGIIADERLVTSLTPVGPALLSLARPALQDPATRGCLLALLREASGADDGERDVEAYVEPSGASAPLEGRRELLRVAGCRQRGWRARCGPRPARRGGGLMEQIVDGRDP